MHGFMSERQRASFERAERERDKALAAGPPEPPLFTVTYRAEGFSEKQDASVQEVADWLRKQMLAKDAKVSVRLYEPENIVHFEIEGDTLEEVEDEDHAENTVIDLLGDGPHQLVLDGVFIEWPEADEPDWAAIAKDRRIEEDWA